MAAVVLAVGIAAGVCRAGAQQADTAARPCDEAARTQTQCPVMTGNEIDPSIYTDYNAKRVFFCCQSCKAAFVKSPERYLSKLPQFASSHGQAQHEEHAGDRSEGLSLRGLAEPTGILTLSLVALTVCLGLARRIRWPGPGLILKLHKTAGACALVSGAIHATIVMLAH